jgi:regulator of replication initiation timing
MQLARIVELQKELTKERSKVAKLEAENEDLRERLSAAEEPTTEVRAVANASAKQKTAPRKTSRR